MKYIDLTFSTPEHNLACDEALLDWSEEGYHHEILRFWEPQEYFIVLGYSQKFRSEVNLLSCQRNRIPILRRSSGGGAILQGPGCLNYSLILKIADSKPLKTITETNSYILKRHKEALQPMIGQQINLQGLSDLACGMLKFSGNAQRRKQSFLLFHGTFLLDFNISLIEKFLPIPGKQPHYRENRPHRNFLANLNVPRSVIKEALRKSWRAYQTLESVPFEKIDQLVNDRYATDAWKFKF